MRLFYLYLRKFYHFVGYKMARFKMWRIMQFVRFAAFYTKDQEVRNTYLQMRYEFHRS